MTTMEIIQATMTMEDDTYYTILDALEEVNEDDEFVYSVQEIAEMFGVALEVVQYIDRAEHCDF
jgi:uncharacterized protein YyaL (SSP411 family)